MVAGSACEKSTGRMLALLQSTTLGLHSSTPYVLDPGWKNEPKNTRLPSGNGTPPPPPADGGSFATPQDRQCASPPSRPVIHSSALAPGPVLPPAVSEPVLKNRRWRPSWVKTGQPADLM